MLETHVARPKRPATKAAPIDVAGYASLGELLADALVQWKSEVALVEVERKRDRASFTYREVERMARALAGAFAERGVGPDTRVAILMTNQWRWLVTATAVFLRGAVLVPIDYKLAPADQLALLTHARPALLVTEPAIHRALDAVRAPASATLPPVLVSELSGEDAERPSGSSPGTVASLDALFAGPPSTEVVPRTRGDLATIVYSSGTSGRPKGCMLTHGNYLAQLAPLVALYPIVVGDRYFSVLPTNHAIDFMCGFVGPLAGGATVVHQRTLRPEFLLDTMKRHRPTHMALVPLLLTAFERAILERLDAASPGRQRFFDVLRDVNASLTRREPRHALSKRLLSPVHAAFGGELRLLFCGGAYVDPERARFFYDLGLPVAIGYGLTEACTVVTVNDLRPFRADTVGKPVRGTDIEVRDVDASGVGEVWVRGPTVMKGYLDDPELTAETVVDGWLKTGDVGRFDAAGHLVLVGRRKNMIVTAGGKNVYPEDVESAFDGAFAEELVVSASSALFPKESLLEEQLVAVVRTTDAARTRAELRTRNERLPDWKRVGGVIFVDEPFPRTASMKVKRDALFASLRGVVGRERVQVM